jgi:hypothetical protein
VHQSDNHQKNLIKLVYNADWLNPANYHLALNTSAITCEQAAELIALLAQKNIPYPLQLPKPVNKQRRFSLRTLFTGSNSNLGVFA